MKLSVKMFFIVLALGTVLVAQDYVPGEILVKFSPSLPEITISESARTNIPSLNASLTSIGTREAKKIFKSASATDATVLRSKDGKESFATRELAYWFKLEVPAGTENVAIARLLEDTTVIYAHPNYYVELLDDPLYDYQWSLHSVDSVYLPGTSDSAELGPKSVTNKHIEHDSIYNDTTAWCFGDSVLIFIIDTGVDTGHADIKGKLFTDGRGRIGYDFESGDEDPFDSHGHGTHVAGIAAATCHNDTGIAGVAGWPGCIKIQALKVFPDGGGSGATDDIAEAIEYCVTTTPSHYRGVANMSLGTRATFSMPVLEAAVYYAYCANIIMVVAAGNNGGNVVSYPACYDYVIDVAATDTLDSLADFSNYTEHTDIGAPGTNILSLRSSIYAYSDSLTISTSTGDYSILSGTSMATPHVSGLVALMLSADSTLDFGDIKANLQAYGDGAYFDRDGFSDDHFKRINARKTLRAICDNRHLALDIDVPPDSLINICKDDVIPVSFRVNGDSAIVDSFKILYHIENYIGSEDSIYDGTVYSDSFVTNIDTTISWAIPNTVVGYYSLELILEVYLDSGDTLRDYFKGYPICGSACSLITYISDPDDHDGSLLIWDETEEEWVDTNWCFVLEDTTWTSYDFGADEIRAKGIWIPEITDAGATGPCAQNDSANYLILKKKIWVPDCFTGTVLFSASADDWVRCWHVRPDTFYSDTTDPQIDGHLDLEAEHSEHLLTNTYKWMTTGQLIVRNLLLEPGSHEFIFFTWDNGRYPPDSTVGPRTGNNNHISFAIHLATLNNPNDIDLVFNGPIDNIVIDTLVGTDSTIFSLQCGDTILEYSLINTCLRDIEGTLYACDDSLTLEDSTYFVYHDSTSRFTVNTNGFDCCFPTDTVEFILAVSGTTACGDYATVSETLYFHFPDCDEPYLPGTNVFWACDCDSTVLDGSGYFRFTLEIEETTSAIDTTSVVLRIKDTDWDTLRSSDTTNIKWYWGDTVMTVYAPCGIDTVILDSLLDIYGNNLEGAPRSFGFDTSNTDCIRPVCNDWMPKPRIIPPWMGGPTPIVETPITFDGVLNKTGVNLTITLIDSSITSGIVLESMKMRLDTTEAETTYVIPDDDPTFMLEYLPHSAYKMTRVKTQSWEQAFPTDSVRARAHYRSFKEESLFVGVDTTSTRDNAWNFAKDCPWWFIWRAGASPGGWPHLSYIASVADSTIFSSGPPVPTSYDLSRSDIPTDDFIELWNFGPAEGDVWKMFIGGHTYNFIDDVELYLVEHPETTYSVALDQDGEIKPWMPGATVLPDSAYPELPQDSCCGRFYDSSDSIDLFWDDPDNLGDSLQLVLNSNITTYTFMDTMDSPKRNLLVKAYNPGTSEWDSIGLLPPKTAGEHVLVGIDETYYQNQNQMKLRVSWDGYYLLGLVELDTFSVGELNVATITLDSARINSGDVSTEISDCDSEYVLVGPERDLVLNYTKQDAGTDSTQTMFFRTAGFATYYDDNCGSLEATVNVSTDDITIEELNTATAVSGAFVFIDDGTTQEAGFTDGSGVFNPTADLTYEFDIYVYKQGYRPLKVQHTNTEIYGNEIWYGDIQVLGDVVAESGDTLTILPGTNIYMKPTSAVWNYAYDVNSRTEIMAYGGHVQVYGTEEDPVHFHPGSGGSGLYQWGGLWAKVGGSFDVRYAQFDSCDGVGGYNGGNGPGRLKLTHTRHIGNQGVFGSWNGAGTIDGWFQMDSCYVEGRAMWYSNEDSCWARACSLSGSVTAGESYYTYNCETAPEFEDCILFDYNYRGGRIYGETNFTNCRFDGTNAAAFINDESANFHNCDVNANTGQYGLYLSSNATSNATEIDSTTFYNFSSYGIYLDGKLEMGVFDHSCVIRDRATHTFYSGSWAAVTTDSCYFDDFSIPGSGITVDTLNNVDQCIPDTTLAKIIGPDSKHILPENFSLGNAVPNPFNSTVAIEIDVPKDAEVVFEVFNILGDKIITLVDEELERGRYKIVWDGLDSAGGELPSGTYLYRLRSDDFQETKKMTLVK